MFASRFLAFLLFVEVCAVTVFAQDTWRTYVDPRFGYRFYYPAYLLKQSDEDAPDGMVKFASGDGQTKITVFAAVNAENISFQKYREAIVTQFPGYQDLKYTPGGRTWFVLSGLRDGSIYYQKVLFSCGGRIINALAMTYPAALKRKYDLIVTGIEKSFNPAYGAACNRVASG